MFYILKLIFNDVSREFDEFINTPSVVPETSGSRQRPINDDDVRVAAA